MKIEFKKHKGGTMFAILDWDIVDLLGLEIGDEIDFKRDGEELYLYRLNPLGHRFGTGHKITNTNTGNKGYSAYSNKLNNYANPGDVFELDSEYIFDELNDVELYEIIKIKQR